MSSYSEEDICKLPDPDFTWDLVSELALYQAMLVHKPAGINKHFSVALVADKLSEQLGKPVFASAIWKKLETLYNLNTVEDREEAIPFSLERKEFCLPRREFESLLLDRRREWRGRSRCFFSQTPSTPKSEGSESRSSPVHRDLYAFHSDDELDLESELDSDEDLDEQYDQLDVESNKSDREDDDREDIDQDKEMLLAEAREEIEKKLKDDLTPKVMLKTARIEPKTPKDDDKVIQKRHITRSTPSSTPTSTPNKRRKL